MLKSRTAAWLLGIFLSVALGQVQDQSPNSTPGPRPPAILTNNNPTVSDQGGPALQIPTASTIDPTGGATGDAASPNQGDGSPSNNGATELVPLTLPATAHPSSTGLLQPQGNTDTHTKSSGLSSSAKIGIGVGVGVGVAAVTVIVGLLFFVRQRRKNAYDSGSSTAQLRHRPAMASSAPVIGAAATMGRSPPAYDTQPPGTITPPEPVHEASASRTPEPLSRTTPQLSLSLPMPEQQRLMPEPDHYERDMPSPMEEQSGSISPVSPISPVDSRPPSPLRDHEK